MTSTSTPREPLTVDLPPTAPGIEPRVPLLLGGLAATNMVGGFLIQWLIVFTLGAGQESDAFFAAMTPQQLILAVFTGSILNVLVPLFAGMGSDELAQATWTVVATVLGLGTMLAVLLHASAPLWVAWVFPGFAGPATALAVRLTRVQLISATLTPVLAVQWASWRARAHLAGPELSGVAATVVTFAVLLWGLPRYGIVAAAWAMVFRTVLQVALLLPGIGRPHRPLFRSPLMALTWRRLRPLLVGTTYYKMEPIIDRYFSSLAGPGGLSLLYLAQLPYSAVSQLLNSAVTIPMVPALARQAKAGQWLQFRRTYRQRTMLVTAMCGCALLAVAVGRPVLYLVFSRTRLTPAEVDRIWWLLLALAGVLVGGAAGQILASAFYAKGDTVTPTRIGIVGFTFGVVLKAAGFARFGLVGLAGATSLYYLLNAGTEYVMLERLHRDRRCLYK